MVRPAGLEPATRAVDGVLRRRQLFYPVELRAGKLDTAVGFEPTCAVRMRTCKPLPSTARPSREKMSWHPGQKSNLQPSVLETDALPVELPRYMVADAVRFELTDGVDPPLVFKTRAIDHSAKRPCSMVRGKGLEPLGKAGFEPAAFASFAIRANVFCGAQGRARTGMALRPAGPQPAASTNFATRAGDGASGWGRTTDACAFNAALYRLSYRSRSKKRWRPVPDFEPVASH